MSHAQCVRSLDGFVFTWTDLPFTISLSRIKESSRGTSSEIQVSYVNGTGKPKTLTPVSIAARQANAAKGRAAMKARREAAK